MFGYVMPVKCQMPPADFEQYRAFYCGLCKQLGQSHGVASRFLLNYDLVLLALLADALSGQQGDTRMEGCFANPVARHPTLHKTVGLQLAADGLVLLSYHKLADNADDEGGAAGRFFYGTAAALMEKRYLAAKARHPETARILEEQMAAQRRLEAAGCAQMDIACDPTAKMCAALFSEAGRNETQRQALHRMGLFTGQIIYLLDAAEDYAEDLKKGRFNVLVNAGYSAEAAADAVRRRCNMAAGEVARHYNQLVLLQHKAILDNIFFLGLSGAIAAAGQKRSNKGGGHGQIDRG